MNIFKMFFLLILIYLSPFINAQKDSSETDKDWNWHWDFDEWDDWSIDFGAAKTNPAISFQYGISEMSRNDLQVKFVKPNLAELKLGYIKDRAAWESDCIIKHSYKYVYLSNTSNKLSGNEAKGLEIESEMWRFGFGTSTGFGYKIGEENAVIPYYTYTMNWSNINFQSADIRTFIPLAENNLLNLYDESFRFGTSNEGGIRVKIFDHFIVDAGYERSIVFQRHLFWKWAGSSILEAAAQGLLDKFINEIFESSPAAGPVVNFLLKNALAYGIYELRQDKMNWPFNSEAPISYDQFKFGFTIKF